MLYYDCYQLLIGTDFFIVIDCYKSPKIGFNFKTKNGTNRTENIPTKILSNRTKVFLVQQNMFLQTIFFFQIEQKLLQAEQMT